MPEPVYLEKDNRFYRLSFQHDLFGCLNVIQTWGSLVKNWQREKAVPVANEEEGKLLCEMITQSKIQRGYRIVAEKKF